MNSRPEEDVSALLVAWSGGDESALDRLMPLVYLELKRLAHSHMKRERPDHLLQTTALVHEAYLRLVGGKACEVESRGHFFAIASQQMRRILVDHARRTDAQKRGSGEVTEDLD